MKNAILVTVIVACTLSTPIVSAQEKSVPSKQTMNNDMDKQMPKMQDSMKKMQGQIEQLRATTDPKERQKLMHEHMETMQENMRMMRGMGGPMMRLNSDPRSGMIMGDKKYGRPDGEMIKRHESMEKRMDMMQMMMEQMMQHDQIMESMPTK